MGTKKGQPRKTARRAYEKKRKKVKKGFINFDALEWAGLKSRDVDVASEAWAKIQRAFERGDK